jgi:hypothetical protein
VGKWFIFYLFLQKRLPDLFELLPNPQLPLGFTAITDHLRAGEVPVGSGLQFGAATVKNSIQFPVTGRIKCGGWWVLNPSCSLALS